MTRTRTAWALASVLAVGASACAGILGFRQASERRPFEHRAHAIQGIACTRCHRGISTAGESGPLHLPDTATCLACHAEPHDRRACSSCHGRVATRHGAAQARHHLRFEHTSHLLRTRGNCVRCHAGVSSDAAQLRPPMAACFTCHAHKDQFSARDCDGCHVDLAAELTRPQSHVVHDGDFVREHGVRAASAGDLCASCHSQRFCATCHGRVAPMLAERLAFDDVMRAGVHRAGFRSRHGDEARTQPGLCTTCHRGDSCRGCHRDRGVAAPIAHGRSPHPPGWLGPSGTRNDHGRAAWRNPAECASCHGGAGEALCIGCHRVGGIGGNPHPMGWSSRRSKSDLPCLLCHGGAP